MMTREPAVAGLFYPEHAARLEQDLTAMLANAEERSLDPDAIRALVVPHAGYIYSGPVAATAYRLLAPRRNQIRRVVLFGPSHRVPFHGLAIPTVDTFRTPLGEIPLDRDALEKITALAGVQPRDDAHAQEHSLEVQLPFLQAVFEDFTLVPVVVGNADPASVDAVLDALWGGDETLVVVSSDLSHFLPYEEASRVDAQTTRAIEQRQETLTGNQACGCKPLNGLLRLARRKGLSVHTLDLRNSGDTAGSRDRVVGYGSYALCR